ncbi:MAG: response regulator [Syntrophobacteraceae bacterium]
MNEGCTLLTIDDEEAIRRSIRVFFEDSGFRVLEAPDGSAGLARFRQEHPDLVLVDLRMPGMSGLEIIDALRAEAPGTPVIVLSGTGIVGDAIEALRRGAWDYVMKPIADLAQLEHVVTMALERARLREESRRYQEHLEEEVLRRTHDLHKLNEHLKGIVQSARAIAGCSSLTELGRRLLDELAANLGAEGGSLYLVENESLVLLHSLDPGHARDTLAMPPPPGSVHARALSQKKPILIRDIRTAKDPAPSGWSGYRDGSLLAIPLVDGLGRSLGVMTLHNKGACPFDDQDREIVDILASYTSEAIRSLLATKELRESEANLRAVMNALPEPALLIDSEGSLIFSNEALAERIGMRTEDLTGKDAYSLLPPDLAKESRARVDTVMRSGRSLEYEDVREGRQFLNYIYPVKSAQGRTSRAAVFALDITERKAAEEELRQEKQFSEAVIESLPGLFFMIDDQGKLVRWNLESERMGGYSREEIDRTLPQEYFIPEDQLRVTRSLQEVFLNGRAELEAQYLTKDGRQIPFYLVGMRQRLRNRDYVIGFGIDISSRRDLEEQLLQAQKMEAIGTLAGGIAHDFNNLLQVMNGYAEIALGQLQEETRAYDSVKHVMAAGERAASLVSQLLVFSRRQVMKPEWLDINAVVSNLLKMVRRIIGEHIRLQFAPGAALDTIHADRGMLEQVLMNLCVNARDAMPEGGNLTIETSRVFIDEAFCENHPEATPGPYVLLSVTDTGSGMSHDVRQRIFEPFFTTKEQGKGTGLGLAAVFGIVKLHDGIISCKSDVGKGAHFDIYFPMRQGPVSEVSERKEAASPRGSETILVAEDDEMVRYLTVELLKSSGYTVLQARDGEEAKTLFTEHLDKIDLLFLDVVMPKMSGRRVFEWARLLRPEVAILFCSGYTENEIDKAFVRERGLELIHKPFKFNTLLQTVRRVLDGASRSKAPGAPE